jgi:hypothetical protein
VRAKAGGLLRLRSYWPLAISGGRARPAQGDN